MDFLKNVFGDEALTFDQLTERLRNSKNIKLTNLAEGRYVDKSKLDRKICELHLADATIRQLRDALKQFEGIDLQSMINSLAAAETKYQTDVNQLKREHAIDLALVAHKARNLKAVKALLRRDQITLEGDMLSGLEEQLKTLKEENKFLFDSEVPSLQGDVCQSDEERSACNERIGGRPVVLLLSGTRPHAVMVSVKRWSKDGCLTFKRGDRYA